MNEGGEALPPAAQRVQDALAALGHAGRVRVMPASTRTSAEAAAAVGCTVAEIAKSIIFRAKPSQRAVLVIASGVNRVDEKKVALCIRLPISATSVMRGSRRYASRIHALRKLATEAIRFGRRVPTRSAYSE